MEGRACSTEVIRMTEPEPSVGGKVSSWVKENLLLVMTILGVVLGVLAGAFARTLEYSSQTVMLVSFPGEIMMRMLKMLILPLIISSIITGVAQLDATASGQMGSRALAYYFGTTICAAVTGIMCVVIIHPGSPTLLKHSMGETPDILKDGSKVTTMDAFLDIVRYTDIVKEERLSCLDTGSSGKMGSRALCYYFSTTILAASLGITMVTSIHPGDPSILVGESQQTLKEKSEEEPQVLDALLDIVRNMFPDNLVMASFSSTKTVYKEVHVAPKLNETLELLNETMRSLLNDTTLNDTSPQTKYERSLTSSEGTNVMGMIVFCVAFGSLIGRMPQGKLMVDFFIILNDVVMKMVELIMWYSPFGIMSLVIGQIMSIEDLRETAQMLGLYMLTVIAGLFVHAMFTLPLMYFMVTRKNPATFFKGMVQAWITALGTGSSSATLPITFRCLEENNKIDKRVTRFVLPVGCHHKHGRHGVVRGGWLHLHRPDVRHPPRARGAGDCQPHLHFGQHRSGQHPQRRPGHHAARAHRHRSAYRACVAHLCRRLDPGPRTHFHQRARRRLWGRNRDAPLPGGAGTHGPRAAFHRNAGPG
ncbi:hypothetical protein O3P69_013175 [Scylla paramamosain]|uniref:Amino acid transporter n=1 Tax=Scylla paramamosain TaxID=85552 RepID=A0AAW0U2F8_SCYPA